MPARTSPEAIAPPSRSPALVSGPAVRFTSPSVYVPVSPKALSSITSVCVPACVSWKSQRSVAVATCGAPPLGG